MSFIKYCIFMMIPSTKYEVKPTIKFNCKYHEVVRKCKAQKIKGT